MERIVARLGEDGGLTLPEAWLRALEVEAGDNLVLVLEEGSVRVFAVKEGGGPESTGSGTTSAMYTWRGKKLKPRRPSIKPKGDKTLSELLVDDRG